MSNLEVMVDPMASALNRGERPDSSGLVLVVAWSWGLDPSTLYRSLAEDIRSLDPENLLVYDATYLHCTVATLSR